MPAGQESPDIGVAPVDLVLSVSAAGDTGDRDDPLGAKVSAVIVSLPDEMSVTPDALSRNSVDCVHLIMSDANKH